MSVCGAVEKECYRGTDGKGAHGDACHNAPLPHVGKERKNVIADPRRPHLQPLLAVTREERDDLVVQVAAHE
jgi:hypothetical protein